ncbi:lipocalin family protein [Candidatus Sumerlaeota bacterium]|nr:lipocalin family protein [Candidatus Sumerlaeota bacterium]
MKKILLAVASLCFTGCLGTPRSVKPVNGFELNRYLGRWYEIARLDHSFERGLDHVTADYALLEDGAISVANRGYSAEQDQWREAAGKAKFVGESSVGHLKVSFFGPFYSSYVIFGLDHDDYQYAYVCGYKTSYLWLLSRTPAVDESILAQFREEAAELGFDTEQLIYVNQQ